MPLGDTQYINIPSLTVQHQISIAPSAVWVVNVRLCEWTHDEFPPLLTHFLPRYIRHTWLKVASILEKKDNGGMHSEYRSISGTATFDCIVMPCVGRYALILF